MALRPATDDDWAAAFGQQPPANWFGLVADRPRLIEGIGTVAQGPDGRWWIGFQRCIVAARLKTAHAGAKTLMRMAGERDINQLFAFADPSIEGAELWLKKLGFEPTSETRGGLTVWVAAQL